MKQLLLAVLGAGVLVGAVFCLKRPQAAPVAPVEPPVEALAAPASGFPATPARVVPAHEPPPPPAASPGQLRSEPAPTVPSPKAIVEAAILNQAVDLLVSSQALYGQKQAAWKQLCDAGKLDQAIGELEKRMTADPHPAEYPAALGQAYLKKCATLQDVREQGILGMQADKLFDAALSLDPSNWEARFTKAVAFSYWPASMNKGEEIIQQFHTLIQQQEAQAPQPHFAESYVWLGAQYQKSGRSDYARAVWERGASFFPNDERLKSKLIEQTEPVRRRVALKIIKLGMDTRSVIARFEAERQALAMMDHPNIAKVLDAGATGTGRPYFVMELVRGIRITDYCDQNNLSTTQRLDLFTQVCHAIQHAHQKGVIHRDIKPSNILVTLHDGVPVPKVIDFGIAKATEGRLTDRTVYTELHQFIGTPAYMSPEQAEMSGLDVDTRSDIYSLGVLLYELLTGSTPFDPQDLLKAGLDGMRRTIREQEPLRPSTRLSTMLNADLTSVAKRHHVEAPKLIHFIRGDLDWIVMKSLEKDRTRRFETASALALDVQRFLRNEPVEARPPSNVYRLQKLARRNKTVFVAAAAVAVALVLGFGLSLHLYLKEATLRQQAEKGWALEKRMHEISQIADKLTAAGYMLSQGEFEKAEQVMSEVPPVLPQSSGIYNVLGNVHARRGEWPAAITNYLRSIQADPTNHFAYHLLTPVLVETGDRAGYQQHRQRMLQHFAGTPDPTVAERIGRDCLLLPPAAGELELIAKMAETAVAMGPKDNGWMKFVKGLAEYRQGHFEEAAKRLQDAAARAADPALRLQADMVLAMTQHALKQSEAARATLVRGVKFAAAKVPQRDGVNWNEQRSAYLFMNEAQALIQPGSPAAAGAK